MPRIAANLGLLFPELPPLERFGAAAAAGFKAVELLFPYAMPPSAVKQELTRHRLTMLGINTSQGREGEFGLAGIPGREQDFDALFRQALDYQLVIGGTAIHCLTGAVPPDQRPAAEATFIRNIGRAAYLAAQHGLTILLEPINIRDRPNYFLTRLEQAAALIGKIGQPNVRIQFDCYHLQIMGGDLITRFEEHIALIGHVQFAGVPGRTEPDTGEVNLPVVLAAIDRLGYAGWCAAEYRPSGNTLDGLAWARPYGIALQHT